MDREKELPKRKDLRLKHYDYSSADAYFVTICTKDRKKLSEIIKPSVGVGALLLLTEDADPYQRNVTAHCFYVQTVL